MQRDKRVAVFKEGIWFFKGCRKQKCSMESKKKKKKALNKESKVSSAL